MVNISSEIMPFGKENNSTVDQEEYFQTIVSSLLMYKIGKFAQIKSTGNLVNFVHNCKRLSVVHGTQQRSNM